MGNAIAYLRITVFHRTVYFIDKCRFMTRWINVQHKSRQNRSYIIWTEDCFVKHLAHPTITLFDGTLINAFYVTAHISEILLKVALNTINITIPIIIFAYPAELWKIHLKFKKTKNNNIKQQQQKQHKKKTKNKTKTKPQQNNTKNTQNSLIIFQDFLCCIMCWYILSSTWMFLFCWNVSFVQR